MKILAAVIIFFVSTCTWATPPGTSSKSKSVPPHQRTYNTFDTTIQLAPLHQTMGTSSTNTDEEDDEKEPLLASSSSSNASGNASPPVATPPVISIPYSALCAYRLSSLLFPFAPTFMLSDETDDEEM